MNITITGPDAITAEDIARIARANEATPTCDFSISAVPDSPNKVIIDLPTGAALILTLHGYGTPGDDDYRIDGWSCTPIGYGVGTISDLRNGTVYDESDIEATLVPAIAQWARRALLRHAHTLAYDGACEEHEDVSYDLCGAWRAATEGDMKSLDHHCSQLSETVESLEKLSAEIEQLAATMRYAEDRAEMQAQALQIKELADNANHALNSAHKARNKAKTMRGPKSR